MVIFAELRPCQSQAVVNFGTRPKLLKVQAPAEAQQLATFARFLPRPYSSTGTTSKSVRSVAGACPLLWARIRKEFCESDQAESRAVVLMYSS